MFSVNTPYTQSMAHFMQKVYMWMFAGLMVTALSSYALFLNPTLLLHMVSSPLFFYGLIAAQFGLVIYISSCIESMSYNAAKVSFLGYSALMGITLSPLFLVYTMTSISLTFASAACMFGAMAIYGYTTNTDLSQFRSILFMGLCGIIIASFANWFFASDLIDFVISLGGVLLFTALTAYDVQKIKNIARNNHYNYEEREYDMSNKLALMGALQLYLDFINLFLYLLRLMGKKRR